LSCNQPTKNWIGGKTNQERGCDHKQWNLPTDIQVQDICLWGERKNDAETVFNPAKTGISFQQWGMTHQKLGFDNKHGELVA